MFFSSLSLPPSLSLSLSLSNLSLSLLVTIVCIYGRSCLFGIVIVIVIVIETRHLRHFPLLALCFTVLFASVQCGLRHRSIRQDPTSGNRSVTWARKRSLAENKHSEDEWNFSFDFTDQMVDLTNPTPMSATSNWGADGVEVGPPVYRVRLFVYTKLLLFIFAHRQ